MAAKQLASWGNCETHQSVMTSGGSQLSYQAGLVLQASLSRAGQQQR